MTVVDIRNIFSDRNIEIVDVTPSYIYYAEEKNDEGHNNLFILEYTRATRRERLVANYSLDDPTFVEHIFALDNSIVLILENGSNSLWLLEIDKKSGEELNRRKVVCTGRFRDCMVLDNEHLLIYMSPDQANAEVFARYKEKMGCDSLCYIYDLKTNSKVIVRSPLIAKIGCEGIRLLNVHGDKYAVILDPFADETIKEKYYKEQRWINADIRDNIWLCRVKEMETELKNGAASITKQCIASADIKAMVRYMGIDGDKIFFRAKEFKSGTEKICSYDAFVNTLAVEATLDVKEGFIYFVEERPFRTFALSSSETKIAAEGIVGSSANITYDNTLGDFMTCIDNRYVVTQKKIFSEEGNAQHTYYYYIYDSQLDKYESYECKCRVKGSTLVLY